MEYAVHADVAAIIFQYPMQADITVPADKVGEFLNSDVGKKGYDIRVVFVGKEHNPSYGKAWWVNGTGMVHRLGAGSAGDFVVVAAKGLTELSGFRI